MYNRFGRVRLFSIALPHGYGITLAVVGRTARLAVDHVTDNPWRAREAALTLSHHGIALERGYI